ncbi:4'-phosphopantetheinyl transferase superfamily protein [Photobacterium makurazakiensis]|uniref:4'-phosphopantetheinyl transferase family protein n=1 Tax=Photobacterium makurazakiensis TaxID=2910234 RepID=UPI003D0EDDB8
MDLHIVCTKHPYEIDHCLNAYECERLNRFQFEKEQVEYSFAHNFKRHVLSNIYPKQEKNKWAFFSNSNGKPFVKEPLSFNLSHSHGAVAIAVLLGESQLNIGVDIECYEKVDNVWELADMVLHPEEQHYLSKEPNINKSFYKIWTAKESLLKADGCGINNRLNTINCAESLDNIKYKQHWQGNGYWLQTVCLGWGALSISWHVSIPVDTLILKELIVNSFAQTDKTLTRVHLKN